MNEIVCAVISAVPERISTYTESLRPLTTRFVFRSNILSLLKHGLPNDLGLVLIDNVEDNSGVVDVIQKTRASGALPTQVLIVISRQPGCEIGIKAIEAGANDYVAFSAVDTELLARARLHLSRDNNTVFFSPEVENHLRHVQDPDERHVLLTVLSCIERKLGQIKSVHDLSLWAGFPAHVINEHFGKYLNTTAFQYVREVRINKAKEQLQHSRIPIAEISDALGYSTAPNFATAFKQVVGMSPSRYRKSTSVNSMKN